MEEKLYFKPAHYNKRSKNQQPAKQPTSATTDHHHKPLKLIIFLLLLLALIIIIILLLRGKTTTTGQYPENIRNESLECIATTIDYKQLNRISPKQSDSKVIMIFYGERSLSSINFRHTMHLDSLEATNRAESIAHVQLAENLADSGLAYEEFDNKITRIDSDLILSLYSSDQFEKDTMYEYFLIKKNTDTGKYPTSLEEFRKNYESQGFSCKSSIDSKKE